jgi:GNAT superfamily N-acetyltransferase
MSLRFTVHDTVPEPEGALVDAGLDASNAAAAPLQDVVPLSCFARLPSGAVVGGAVGRTWGECCELQQLWVDEARRRQGIGADLVRAFEAHAQARGCRTYYLETFSFQAPSLYRSLGYEVAVALEGFGPGIVKYLMVRRSVGHTP